MPPYLDAPSRFLIRYFAVADVLKLEQLHAKPSDTFIYDFPSPEEAQQPLLPRKKEHQFKMVVELAKEGAFSIVSGNEGSEFLTIKILDEDKWMSQYNKLANTPRMLKQRKKEIDSGESDRSIEVMLQSYNQPLGLTFSNDGVVSFGSAHKQLKAGSKSYAVVKFLYEIKPDPASIDSLKEFANPNIVDPRRKVRSLKDVDDMIRDLRRELGVSKGAYFPIAKEGRRYLIRTRS